MPRLSLINIYPVKSLDAVSVPQSRITAGGALLHDREYAVADPSGRFVNGKRHPIVHSIRSSVDVDRGSVTLNAPAEPKGSTFQLPGESEKMAIWFEQQLGFPVSVRRNVETGFPDDSDAPGPTVVSTETLAEVATWFDGLTIDDVRRRFRANLEISGVAAFWEDRLFGKQGSVVRFRIGDVEFEGTGPCARCVVPSRDSRLGIVTPDFQNNFIAHRKGTLPSWAERERFDHFYRLSVNTRIRATEAGKTLSVGDEVVVV